jgi:hypothetical protein
VRSARIPRPAGALAALERSKVRRIPADDRLALLKSLDRRALATAAQVRLLHELLCFLRAYPDDARIESQVVAMLDRFDRRADLRRHRDALAYSGIAGTLGWFPYFWPTAEWLASRWPDALRFDRRDSIAGKSLARVLPQLVTPVEAAALREAGLAGYAAIDRLRGRVSDATFLIRRVRALPGNSFTREAFYDAINPSIEVLPDGTPSRTKTVFERAPHAFRAELRTGRPDLHAELVRPPRAVRRLPVHAGRELIEVARCSLATRQRDLDAFAYGNPRDVWLIDDGGGLAFALVGMTLARRAVLAATYGGLTLQNGVPIGYYQVDVAGSAALSFNTFETFRGSESATVFARWMAALHMLFGVRSFSIEPYQLGKGNDEGIDSGAWWFYYKLGFRPRAVAARRLVRSELARMRADPAHRSPRSTLLALAVHPLLFELDRPRAELRADRIGLAAAARLARAAGADREQAVREIARAASRSCGVRSLGVLSAAERAAWLAYAPLLALLPIDRWSLADRRALARLIRAKAEVSEIDYARRFNEHTTLQRALAAY